MKLNIVVEITLKCINNTLNVIKADVNTVKTQSSIFPLAIII